ncbi:hypothetical protein ACOTJH_29085 [Achromobacter xylosoxidans]
MTAKDTPTVVEHDEQLALLHRVDGKIDAMNGKLDMIHQQVRKKAVVYGATAGGLTGGIVAFGVAIVKAKLGM